MTTSFRLTSMAVVVALLCHGAGAIRASGALVSCDVVVLNALNQPISGVTAADLEVLSDGVRLPVVSLVSAPPEVNIVLLVDLSTSQPLKRYEVHAAMANHWIPSLLPADSARLGVVGNPPVFSELFLNDRAATVATARATVDRALSEPSPIWDSANAAVNTMAGRPGTRIVVLVTDGRATGNAIGVEDLALRAIASDVAIGVVSEGGEVFLPQKDDAIVRVRTDTSLKWLAQATGGVYVEDGAARRIASPRIDSFAYAWDLVHKPNQPGPSLVSLMNALRSRYRLTFEAAVDGKTHTLDVRINTPGATVRAKQSYVAVIRR